MPSLDQAQSTFMNLVPGSYQAPQNKFNATGANLDYTSYADAIRQAMEQQGMAAGQQNQQIADLQAAAHGQGPSVAQNMLNQATQANIASGAAAVGSQRGMNPALAARMAIQNQAAMNQQAAGQGATMRAQEQLGAQNALAQALAAKRQQDLGMFGASGGLQNAQNMGNIQNTLGTNQINAGVAQQNAALQLAAKQGNAANLNSYVNGVTGAGSGLLSAVSGMPMGGGGGGGGGGGVSSYGWGSMAPQPLAYGGVAEYAQGGSLPLGGGGSSPNGHHAFAMALIKHGLAMLHGGQVPGHAMVHGDSPQNDVVPAMLSPHEVVLPRSVAMAPDAPARAAEFVKALRARKAA